MAHTKQLGSTKLGRESASKRLGVKRQQDQRVNAGEILIRQRGTQYLAGKNVLRAGDDTLYASVSGKVQYKRVKKTKFDGRQRYATKVSIKAI
jgi:large subunit ribosomal protein L27